MFTKITGHGNRDPKLFSLDAKQLLEILRVTSIVTPRLLIRESRSDASVTMKGAVLPLSAFCFGYVLLFASWNFTLQPTHTILERSARWGS